MTIQRLAAFVGALTVIASAIIWPLNYFQSKVEAAEAEQKHALSVNELRAEIHLKRIKEINSKPNPSKDEQDEKDMLLALVKQIQAEQIKAVKNK